MLSRVTTFAIEGVEPRRVSAEIDIRLGLDTFTIVGLGDAAVRESRERIRAAIQNSGFDFPKRRITANLAPASLRKAGPGFDVALALGILASSGQIPAPALQDVAVYGELSLGGEIREAAGALVVAEGTRRHAIRRLIVPLVDAGEAALVDGVSVAGVRSLREAVAVITGARTPRGVQSQRRPASQATADLRDVRGHAVAIQALQIAAAGGHNILLEGPPGTGKTMLARRVPSILPPLTREEALDVTRIHSVTGRGTGGLIQDRPFRAPHHGISAAGLVGGGSSPRPGEATYAHLGVLFLDELSEFHRTAVEALRQPLEDGHVTIVRGQRALRLPTRFMLVAATNPCPCGYAGSDGRCICAEADLRRHRRRLSGPLLDRVDLLVPVARPSDYEMASGPICDSETVRAKVSDARERQLRRLVGTGARNNAEMDSATLQRVVKLDEAGDRVLSDAYRRGAISGRGRYRLLRVSQTVADLSGHDVIERTDMLIALGFRQRASADEVIVA